METRYEISLQMKTLKGIAEYGCFNVGKNEHFAAELYQSLVGSEQISPDSVITIDLIKWHKGIPYPVGLKHCSYEQLAINVKLITKELFKQINLE